MSKSGSEESVSNEHEDNKIPVKFLESLVLQYESLVQEMSNDIDACKILLKNQIQDEQKYNPYQQDEFELLSIQLSQKSAIIENLQKQLEVCTKSKYVSKSLWQYTLQHIEETLESKKESTPNNQNQHEKGTKNMQNLPQNFLTKWKLLQTYAKSLEERLGKATIDANFYRDTVLRVRMEYETALKTQAIQSSKEKQEIKVSFSKEINYLRSSIETIRKEHKTILEKRLKEEKEAWLYQESKKLELVRFQVEQVLLANEALVKKEREYAALIKSKESELENSKIHFAQSHELIECIEALTKLKEEQNPKEQNNQANKKCQVTPTDLDFVHTDQLQRLKSSYSQLEFEYNKIHNKLETHETETRVTISRLQSRIQQLETINATLHVQISDLTCQKSIHTKKPINNISQNNQSHNPNPPISKELLIENQKVVSISSQDLEEVETTNKELDNQRQEMKILILKQEIQHLKEDRVKILEVIEKQKNLTNKWKSEFKELAKQMLPT